MIKIEPSKNGWIVYESRDFKRFHTHVKFYRVAKKIKQSVKRGVIPTTDSIELLTSCIRLSSDRLYIEKLKERIKELE